MFTESTAASNLPQLDGFCRWPQCDPHDKLSIRRTRSENPLNPVKDELPSSDPFQIQIHLNEVPLPAN